MVRSPDYKSTRYHFRDFQVEEEPQESVEKRCVAAEQFHLWIEQLCQQVEKKRDPILIRQGQLLLLYKFFEWQKALEPSHRQCSGKKRHVCVFEMFERGYDRLTLHQLCLEPLLIEHPPAPPTTTIEVVEIPGVTAAEFIKR